MAPTTCPSATMSGSKRTPMTPVAPAKKILIPLPHTASLVHITSACTIVKTVALSKTRVFERDKLTIAREFPHGLQDFWKGCLPELHQGLRFPKYMTESKLRNHRLGYPPTTPWVST